MKDSNALLKIVRALDPAQNTNLGTTALTGQWVNRKQAGILFNSLLFAIAIGTLSDANAVYAVTLDEADDDGAGSVDAGTIAAVAATDILNAANATPFQFDDDNEVRQIGYIGTKQYVRIVITPTTAADAGNTPVSAVAVLSNPTQLPTA